MTPKIVTRLANIAAKLAGSDKYDPTIEPVTALEYYLNKGVDKILAINGVPAAEAGDAGKVLTVGNRGRPVWEDKTPLVVTFAGATPLGTATCDKTWAEIQSAITAGRTIKLRYNTNSIYGVIELVCSMRQGAINGYLTFILDPADTSTLYLSISCGCDSDNDISIYVYTNAV